MKRQTWIGPATLAVAVAILLWLVIPWAVGRNDQAPSSQPSPTTPVAHVLHIQVDGDATLIHAEYVDADGTHLDPTVNGDIRVVGLRRVVVAVYGKGDLGCSILLEGITESAEGSNTGDEPNIDICTYEAH